MTTDFSLVAWRAVRPLMRLARFVPRPVRRMVSAGRERFCPVCETGLRCFVPFGVVPRAEAMCPVCGALERHRLMWLYLREQTDLVDPRQKRVLHFAPEPELARHIKAIASVKYMSADREPGAMSRMDITRLPLRDNSFDVIYCSHVLEHVGDDRAALAELHRVMKPGGWGILQVPVRGDVTMENLAVTDPAERERLYGQADHVRQYGRDYAIRLRDAGFLVTADAFVQRLPPAEVRRQGLAEDDIYVVRKAAD